MIREQHAKSSLPLASAIAVDGTQQVCTERPGEIFCTRKLTNKAVEFAVFGEPFE
jgi:hypothetical protein